MKSRNGLTAQIRYRFDSALSRGPIVVVAYLGALTTALILVAALVASAFHIAFGDGSNAGLIEDLWQTVLRTLDPGTFANDTSWPSRVLALVVTLTGIFLAGSLIGLIANAVDQRVERLRLGRSQVLEKAHTVILGWSPQVPEIVSELVVANESEKRACVVILSEVDKAVAEAEVRQVVPDARTTKLVFRTGDPANPDDLLMCALGQARSVVIVRSDGDARVIRAILAVHAVDHALDKHRIVAELANEDHASTIRNLSNGQVVTVCRERIVAEVMAQACLQAGLAAVFIDLLDFDGDEIYFTPAGDLVGRTYREALLAFEASSVIGRITASHDVDLNPPMGSLIEPGDRLVVISEDDSTVVANGDGVLEEQLRSELPPHDGVASRRPLHIVVIGWSNFGAIVAREIDEFLVPGSHIDVLVEEDLVRAEDVDLHGLTNATTSVRVGSGTPEDLLAIEGIEDVDQILVLAYRGRVDRDEADARTMLTLLTLRSQAFRRMTGRARIVAELLDQRNVRLAAPVGADDLIVSDALAALFIAQLSERAELDAIFKELFTPDGAVVELRPARQFSSSAALPFRQLVLAGAAAGCSVIGHRSARSKQVVLNPSKSTTVTLEPEDNVIVIATREEGSPSASA